MSHEENTLDVECLNLGSFVCGKSKEIVKPRRSTFKRQVQPIAKRRIQRADFLFVFKNSERFVWSLVTGRLS
jgi:hypothetical protein